MEFPIDYAKLASATLPRSALQDAFNVMLMNCAAIDCETVIDPDTKRAEFGESLAVNLAMTKRFSPAEAPLYRTLLADYLRFCRTDIASSDVADDGFDRHVLKALMRRIRDAYQKGKKEIPNIY